MPRLLVVLVISLLALGFVADAPASSGTCFDICQDEYQGCLNQSCSQMSPAMCLSVYNTCRDCCTRYGLPCSTC